ncbi:MAG: TlpA family protein disulfide reductase [Tenacibaculum sp.]|nr:TlpA family protein disulfide reductase [Tenacibaculum sp.]
MTKSIYLSLMVLVFLACKTEPKDYVTFSGKINNPNSKSLTISNPKIGYKKTISVNEKGVFKDTLKVKTDYYSVFDGNEYTTVYLKNGDDIKMTLDTKEFDETIKFEGKGAEESSFLAKLALQQEELFFDKNLFSLDKEKFDLKINNFISKISESLESKDFDSNFVTSQKQNIEGLKQMFVKKFEENKYMSENLRMGSPSPKFVDYENYNGGTTSLDDFKGKYVYIDLWATWCPPCRFEIPYMKKLEEKYHNKNIEFVSISIDSPRSYEKWKQMVKDKGMTGVQLHFKGDKEFMQEYKVRGIPRFILLDPKGNIVDANAPRPSDSELIKLFNSLKL